MAVWGIFVENIPVFDIILHVIIQQEVLSCMQVKCIW